MMRWVEWWNAMRKGDRGTAQLLLIHHFAIGHCTPSPKVIGRLDDPDVPEAASAHLQPYHTTAEEDSHARRIKLSAPRGISSPFV